MGRKQSRQKIIDSTKVKLMGPGEVDELLREIPTQRYKSGIIYPQIIVEEDSDEEMEGPLDEQDDSHDLSDDDIHTDSHVPRSMGLSCIIDLERKEEIVVWFSGAIYSEGKNSRAQDVWQRHPIAKSGMLSMTEKELGMRFGKSKKMDDKELENMSGGIGRKLHNFVLHWETSPYSDADGKVIPGRYHISLFLVNNRKCSAMTRAVNSLYQIYIRIDAGKKGGIYHRQRVSKADDPEVASTKLLYHDRHEFGVGHSTSVNWNDLNDSDTRIPDLVQRSNYKRDGKFSELPSTNILNEENNRCNSIETTFFPEYRMPKLVKTKDGIDLSVLELCDLEFLKGGSGKRNENISLLRDFSKEYEKWIGDTFSPSEKRKFSEFKGFGTHKKQCKESLRRINEGIALLDSDSNVYKAFCLMNRAILLQYINAKMAKNHTGENYTMDTEHAEYQKEMKWYPFQMGFILQNLCALADPIHSDREIVDLLWVPTGGGKTEAYLGQIAFILFLERIQTNIGADIELKFDENKYDLDGKPTFVRHKENDKLRKIAHYRNLISGLEKAIENEKHEEMNICVKSKEDFIVRQLNDEWPCKSEELKPLHSKAMRLLSKFRSTQIVCKTGGTLDRKDNGCEVIMRYTLRLLSLQQFQRATRLIMACEHIRLIDNYIDGEKFTIGLYVGQKTTPNLAKRDKKRSDYDVYRSDPRKNERFRGTADYAITHWRKEGEPPKNSNPIQILNCQWCGEELGHGNHKIRNKKCMDICCSNGACMFKNNPMPHITVDSHIYEEPPSLLIATVDKFAQLPFNNEIGNIFGFRNGERVGKPPKLIVQDELHLINGPLGSMVGIYEGTIDMLCTEGLNITGNYKDPANISISKRGPKIIASTATIRNAEKQCKYLYNRGLSRFPASGTHVSDSFFVSQQDDDSGDKAYIGLYCTGAGGGWKTALKNTTSSVMKKAWELKQDPTIPLEDYDPYWTVVVYFNSKRELGGGVSLMQDDIKDALTIESARPTIQRDESVQELKGGLKSIELVRILQTMEIKAGEPGALDALLCTLMFSVGVDVTRLGLMLVNGQPKATTEYMQSTGRVGRDGEGLVMVLHNQARPRDQSHFETFYDYHARIHVHVESITVTPFSAGAMDRALHAQYVALMRMASTFGTLNPIHEKHGALEFTDDHRNHPRSEEIVNFFVKRAYDISVYSGIDQHSGMNNAFVDFQDHWLTMVDECKRKPVPLQHERDASMGPRLYYRGNDWLYWWPRLLEQDVASVWLDSNKLYQERRTDSRYPDLSLVSKMTPNSLRNVEEEVQLAIEEVR